MIETFAADPHPEMNSEPKVPWLELLRTAETYKLSSTQVQLPGDFLQFGLTIPDEDLDAQGRETDPHVTLKYGIETSDPEVVRPLLAGRGPITMTFGKMAYSEADAYDVVFVTVRSEDLMRLNALISSSLPVTDTYPVYLPHATVAYVKKGLGAKYADDAAFEGRQVVASAVTFSSADGTKTVLSVG